MSERKFPFVPGEYYHIYNRGNSKQEVFLNSADYVRFMRLLFVANASLPFKLFFLKDPVADFERGETLVCIGAYCLMPNHFHLLVTPKSEEGLSRFMQKLTTAYSMYFNNKYDRTGALFEGKFKAELATDDIYLKYLFSYIHLNPIKLIQSDWKERGIENVNATTTYLNGYRFSSFLDYAGEERKESLILDKSMFPPYFNTSKEFQSELFEWITFNKQP